MQLAPTDVVIDAQEAAVFRRLRAVWDARALVVYFVRRDLVGRYRPTSLGRAWVFLRPAAELLTYVLVFGFILKVRTADMPYALFLAAGLVPWLFFAQTVSGSADSLASARHIMSKVHFPRLVVPLSNMGLALVDLVVLSGVVLVLALAYGMPLGLPLLALPFFLGLLVLLAFGVSLIVAAASVSSPDVAVGVPVALRVLMYLSPVVYPRSLVPAEWLVLYDANPIATILTGVRWSLGSAVAPGPVELAFACLVVAGTLAVGTLAFLRTERQMADFL